MAPTSSPSIRPFRPPLLTRVLRRSSAARAALEKLNDDLKSINTVLCADLDAKSYELETAITQSSAVESLLAETVALNLEKDREIVELGSETPAVGLVKDTSTAKKRREELRELKVEVARNREERAASEEVVRDLGQRLEVAMREQEGLRETSERVSKCVTGLEARLEKVSRERDQLEVQRNEGASFDATYQTSRAANLLVHSSSDPPSCAYVHPTTTSRTNTSAHQLGASRTLGFRPQAARSGDRWPPGSQCRLSPTRIVRFFLLIAQIPS